MENSNAVFKEGLRYVLSIVTWFTSYVLLRTFRPKILKLLSITTQYVVYTGRRCYGAYTAVIRKLRLVEGYWHVTCPEDLPADDR